MAGKRGQSTRSLAVRTGRRNGNRRNRRRATNRANSNIGRGTLVSKVHRRLALFPTSAESKWLTSLSWFASVAMKVISLIVGVEDTPNGLRAQMVPTSSGTVILLGPGDFASHSSFASFYSYNVNTSDADMFSLRSLPFERMGLQHLQIKIAPTVDLGKRGGLYAVVLERLDVLDSRASVESNNIQALIKRFPTDYQDIIKHPRAKLSPVTRPVSLSMPGSSQLYDIKARNDVKIGWVNDIYTHVLCIAFSDLAAVKDAISDNYSPTHGLFEVHMSGTLRLSDPAELTVSQDLKAPTDSVSVVTAKIVTNGTGRLTKFYHHVVEEHPEHHGMLYSYPENLRRDLVNHFGVAEPPGFSME